MRHALAVIAKAQELTLGKPIRYVIAGRPPNDAREPEITSSKWLVH